VSLRRSRMGSSMVGDVFGAKAGLRVLFTNRFLFATPREACRLLVSEAQSRVFVKRVVRQVEGPRVAALQGGVAE
jgi:hypothetical protein